MDNKEINAARAALATAEKACAKLLGDGVKGVLSHIYMALDKAEQASIPTEAIELSDEEYAELCKQKVGAQKAEEEKLIAEEAKAAEAAAGATKSKKADTQEKTDALAEAEKVLAESADAEPEPIQDQEPEIQEEKTETEQEPESEKGGK